jgi:Fic family protein
VNFDKIDALLWQADERRLAPEEIERLAQKFLIELTYHSNSLEGNTLTLQETARIINEDTTIANKPLKDHLAVIGHKEAFRYVQELARQRVSLSERVIKEIHSIVLMDKPRERGVYRHIPVHVKGGNPTPPHPWEVPFQMDLLLDHYEKTKDQLHPIERAASFHLQFEDIHPFADANRRTGRLLLNLELMKAGYPAINIKYSDRYRYDDCFSDYFRSGGNCDALTEMIAAYVQEALEKSMLTPVSH